MYVSADESCSSLYTGFKKPATHPTYDAETDLCGLYRKLITTHADGHTEQWTKALIEFTRCYGAPQFTIIAECEGQSVETTRYSQYASPFYTTEPGMKYWTITRTTTWSSNGGSYCIQNTTSTCSGDCEWQNFGGADIVERTYEPPLIEPYTVYEELIDPEEGDPCTPCEPSTTTFPAYIRPCEGCPDEQNPENPLACNGGIGSGDLISFPVAAFDFSQQGGVSRRKVQVKITHLPNMFCYLKVWLRKKKVRYDWEKFQPTDPCPNYWRVGATSYEDLGVYEWIGAPVGDTNLCYSFDNYELDPNSINVRGWCEGWPCGAYFDSPDYLVQAPAASGGVAYSITEVEMKYSFVKDYEPDYETRPFSYNNILACKPSGTPLTKTDRCLIRPSNCQNCWSP
jgi:hypothetical protein